MRVQGTAILQSTDRIMLYNIIDYNIWLGYIICHIVTGCKVYNIIISYIILVSIRHGVIMIIRIESVN